MLLMDLLLKLLKKLSKLFVAVRLDIVAVIQGLQSSLNLSAKALVVILLVAQLLHGLGNKVCFRRIVE